MGLGMEGIGLGENRNQIVADEVVGLGLTGFRLALCSDPKMIPCLNTDGLAACRGAGSSTHARPAFKRANWHLIQSESTFVYVDT